MDKAQLVMLQNYEALCKMNDPDYHKARRALQRWSKGKAPGTERYIKTLFEVTDQNRKTTRH